MGCDSAFILQPSSFRMSGRAGGGEKEYGTPPPLKGRGPRKAARPDRNARPGLTRTRRPWRNTRQESRRLAATPAYQDSPGRGGRCGANRAGIHWPAEQTSPLTPRFRLARAKKSDKAHSTSLPSLRPCSAASTLAAACSSQEIATVFSLGICRMYTALLHCQARACDFAKKN